MDPVKERIESDLKTNDVVLYMKGTPVFPQCGFSAAVVQVLTHMGVKFKGINVLEDPELRQGIKEFTNWPTIPWASRNGTPRETSRSAISVAISHSSAAAVDSLERSNSSPRIIPVAISRLPVTAVIASWSGRLSSCMSLL